AQMNTAYASGNCPCTSCTMLSTSTTAAAVSDPTDEKRVIANAITQPTTPNNITSGAIASSTPPLVATALPPLNDKYSGYVCPRMADKPTNTPGSGGSGAPCDQLNNSWRCSATNVGSHPFPISPVLAIRT